MPTPLLPARLPVGYRRTGAVLTVLVVVALLLLSHTFGRAVPTNNYRPLLTADPVESGCYPLPGGASLAPLSYQVRRDGDVETPDGRRRHLHGQYNLVERDEAERLLLQAFRRVGFREDPDAEGLRLVRPSAEPDAPAEVVRIAVTELPDTSEETLVRGEFVLDLPVAARAKDDPACEKPRDTKRWGERQ